MKFDHPDFDLTKRYKRQAPPKHEAGWLGLLGTAVAIVGMLAVAFMLADAFIRNS